MVKACEIDCKVSVRFDDLWQTPCTGATLSIKEVNGDFCDEGGRTKGLANFGLQDGQDIETVSPELGTHTFKAPQAAQIEVEVVAQDFDSIKALEASIIGDLRQFKKDTIAELTPWQKEWEKSGYIGLVSTYYNGLWNGVSSWWEGESEFWSSVGNWLSDVPEMLEGAWNDLSEGAKGLWENKDRIIGLLESLATGHVHAFEEGMEALAEAFSSIPSMKELADTFNALVKQSKEWAAAMITLSTQTEVLKVLSATLLSVVMAVPPPFWVHSISTGLGFLLPEILIEIVLWIISLFTAGTGGVLLASRLGVLSAKVAKLAKVNKASEFLLKIFKRIEAMGDKFIALIKKVKKRVSAKKKANTGELVELKVPAALKQVRNPALEAHYKNLADYEAAYKKKLATAIENGDSKQRIGAFKAKLTEVKGERAASAYMAKHFSKPPPPAKMELGFGPGPGIDQVWAKRDKDGNVLKYFIVEAKGPGAKLGKTSKGFTQMDDDWIEMNLERMKKSKKYPERNQLGQDLLDAKINRTKINKLVIEAVEENGKIIGGTLQSLGN